MMRDPKTIEETVSKALEQLNVELVDLVIQTQGHKKVLQFFVDKAGGVTLDDCGELTDKIDARQSRRRNAGRLRRTDRQNRRYFGNGKFNRRRLRAGSIFPRRAPRIKKTPALPAFCKRTSKSNFKNPVKRLGLFYGHYRPGG